MYFNILRLQQYSSSHYTAIIWLELDDIPLIMFYRSVNYSTINLKAKVIVIHSY